MNCHDVLKNIVEGFMIVTLHWFHFFIISALPWLHGKDCEVVSGHDSPQIPSLYYMWFADFLRKRVKWFLIVTLSTGSFSLLNVNCHEFLGNIMSRLLLMTLHRFLFFISNLYCLLGKDNRAYSDHGSVQIPSLTLNYHDFLGKILKWFLIVTLHGFFFFIKWELPWVLV